MISKIWPQVQFVNSFKYVLKTVLVNGNFLIRSHILSFFNPKKGLWKSEKLKLCFLDSECTEECIFFFYRVNMGVTSNYLNPVSQQFINH